jgi:hypothetical protein
MKNLKVYPLVTACFVVLFCSSIQVFACACCSEPGTYSISVKKPDSYELDQLKRIKFATTNIYMDAGFSDSVKGISPISENYTASCLFQSNTWKLNFKDDKGKSGMLSLPLPATMVDFKADIHDKPKDSGDPVLYKEWRFKYKVGQGTGIFQTGIAPATEYFLVLQGRGNNCTQAEDFTHWRLEITGKKANYAFFGETKAE